MKILIVNTYDRGGAANACLRLHQGLLKEGIDAKVLLKSKEKPLVETYQFQESKGLKSRFQLILKKGERLLRRFGLVIPTRQYKAQQFLKNRPKGLEFFSFPQSNFDITASSLYKEADIINLHWVAGFLDFESFFRKNTKPVVWTLHDMNPFTGGEHYLEKILGINASGFPVTRQLSEIEIKVLKKNLALKKTALSNVKKMHIVSLCNWMSSEVSVSSLFKNYDVSIIPNGINSEIFKPRDKGSSKTELNISKDKTVILFVADSVSNHRKGYAFLKHALEMLQRDDIVLCTVGNTSSTVESLKNTIGLGVIDNELLMSKVYSSADVFVIPSLMDNLPNTVLESLLCGTPVIGFPVGGIVDMVKSGVNGLITENISSQSLLVALEQFLDTKNTFNREKIREVAEQKYDLSIQTKSYVELFKNVLKNNKN